MKRLSKFDIDKVRKQEETLVRVFPRSKSLLKKKALRSDAEVLQPTHTTAIFYLIVSK